MYKLKELLLVLVVVISFEVFRAYTGLSMTLIDVIFFPASILILFFLAKYLITSKSKKQINHNKKTPMQFFYYIVLFIVFCLLGFWCIYAGWQAPFQLFSGVKGVAHGYTLISLGVLISSVSIWGVFKMAQEIKAQ